MTILETQQLFTSLLADFLLQLEVLGYKITLGEAWRPDEMARLYAQQGKGITNSLHCMRLAIDLNIFKDGKFLQTVEDLTPVGEMWEHMSNDDHRCCWGGRFAQPDSDHFSVQWGSVR